MSNWSDYISNYLLASTQGETVYTNPCDRGALIGNDGTVWASTEGFSCNTSQKIQLAQDDGSTKEITINEVENILDCTANKGRSTKPGGVYICGEKFFSVGEPHVYGDESKHEIIVFLKSKSGGGAVGRTTAGNLVVATWNASKKCTSTKDGKSTSFQQVGAYCNKAVENLTEFLSSNSL